MHSVKNKNLLVILSLYNFKVSEVVSNLEREEKPFPSNNKK